MGVVTAFETVYFWGELSRCFSETYRVLEKGGVFLIVNELKKEKDRPDKYRKIHDVLDLTIYDEEELTDALKRAGFSETKTYTQGEDWICVVATK